MKKIKVATFSVLAILSACSLPITTPTELNTGTISINNNNRIIEGIAEFPQPRGFSTKATTAEVSSFATVALLYPPDHPTNANETIATGLSKANGSFSINPGAGFSQVTGQIYVLEATKRIGNAGNAVMSLRTYLRWSGTAWQSITNPGIRLSKNTTALTIIDARDSSIASADLIGSMPNNTVADIGSLSSSTINKVSGMVEFLLTANVDPTKFIDYQNNKYFLSREVSLTKAYLLANNQCKSCDLQLEDLNGLNLTGANLTNANLSEVNFTGANLSGANLTGANISNTDFTAATWINGITTCANGSIGTCIFPDILVNTSTVFDQTFPSVSMDADGDFVITWTSYNQDGSYSGIYAQRYTSTGAVNGSEFRVNTYTDNAQKNSSIAMDADGDFVITWQSSGQDGSDYGIYAQRYTSTGVVNGSEFRINTYTIGQQRTPSVAMDADGDFVITWQSNNQDGGILGVYAQRYTSTGAVNGSEFRVNTYTNSAHNRPNVAMDADGDFVITWQATEQDGSSEGIYAQRYNSDGSVNGSEFQVNTYTTGNQATPIVAMDADGDFVITWYSYQDGSYDGIYAQRYASDGSLVGSEFQVNTYTTNTQNVPRVVMDADGDFVITWQSNGQDGAGYGIYAQRYASDGSLVGSEFRVNTYTTGNQKEPIIAMDADGDFVITWQSNQDGDYSGVYSKRYDSSGQNQ